MPYHHNVKEIFVPAEFFNYLFPGGIVSYNIPEDTSWKDGNEYLSDLSYDGKSENGYLVNGLGRLVDGILGGDNFKIDIGYGKGKYKHLSPLQIILDNDKCW